MLGSPYARMCGSSERAKWDLPNLQSVNVSTSQHSMGIDLALCSLFQGILCWFSKDSMDFLLSPVEFFLGLFPTVADDFRQGTLTAFGP